MLDELLDSLAGWGRHRGATVEHVRLDRPGLLARVQLHVARCWYFQYRCYNVMIADVAGERYLLPARDGRAIDTLPAYALSRAHARIQGIPPRIHHQRSVASILDTPDLDLVPLLHDDLAHAMTLGAAVDAIALVDRLATYPELGSTAFEPPIVELGPEIRVTRTDKHDSTVGGYRRETCMAALTFGDGRWRYERRLLAEHDEPGIEMS